MYFYLLIFQNLFSEQSSTSCICRAKENRVEERWRKKGEDCYSAM